ncbi:PSME3-interacting protein [Nasonia vitripennis]|uniref:FAM192A/Fyv6 N-terminal domain-containing protein n=1 Tax=Nasonia vitripennis TaxID=7425 RepID=A0A7M7G7E9_NASVI|nr:PSME3-interacting protein [Nasonia vitripennis]
MSSGFISEAEIAEQRKIRQEEWEKVRSADQPIEAPEEVYDPRCLYDRLQEQKNKRDADYEEAHKLKNMIKGLDDDEVEFLDLVDRTKMEEERKKNMEEEKEMHDFKAAVASLQEKSLDERLKQELKQPVIHNKSATSSNKNSQLRLLAGVVVKKPAKSESATKRKLSDSEDKAEKTSEQSSEKQAKKNNETKVLVPPEDTEVQTGALKCVAILPGLGSYSDSSDSDNSSDSEQETTCKQVKIDMLGREIQPPKEKEEGH